MSLLKFSKTRLQNVPMSHVRCLLSCSSQFLAESSHISGFKYQRNDYHWYYRCCKLGLNEYRKYSSTETRENRKRDIQNGPDLKKFIQNTVTKEFEHCNDTSNTVPYLMQADIRGDNRHVYFETYGCQMNVNDTEIAWSILKDAGYQKTNDVLKADVILVVTCAIRENAEKKVWSRLGYFRNLKSQRRNILPPLKIGVLGCMAERLKEKLLETDKMIDLVAGPDSYRDLPRMLSLTDSGQASVNVLLSLDETYADITPVRMNTKSHTAFVSIMRGCDNMCSFCIVPFTRGRERSRPFVSILNEIKSLSNEGIKEITLLGQNVNSYRDLSSSSLQSSSSLMSRGFSTIYKTKEGGKRFAELIHRVSQVDDEMRIRFTSPHPKDFPDELLKVIKSHDNVCSHIHLPAQSGSTTILQKMRRGHTRESYLELVEKIRETIPGVTLSSDFIVGFCGETEEDHEDTMSLMRTVQFDMAYMYAYSMRKKTHAYHRMIDDVPEETKRRRLQELVDSFYSLAAVNNQRYIDTDQLVLVEHTSKRSQSDLVGRTDGNIKVVFPSIPLQSHLSLDSKVIPKPGDYVKVKISSASSLTLRGEPLYQTTLKSFMNEIK